jgi:hypothetical protein
MGLAGLSFFLRLISFGASGLAMVLLIAYIFQANTFKEYGMTCATSGSVFKCAKKGDYFRGRGLIFSTVNFCKDGKTLPSGSTSPKTYDGEACTWTYNWMADTQTKYLTTKYQYASAVSATDGSTSPIVSNSIYTNRVVSTTKSTSYEGDREKFNEDLNMMYNNAVAALFFLIGAFFLFLASLLNSAFSSTAKLIFFGRLLLDILLIVFVFQGLVIGFSTTLANYKYTLKPETPGGATTEVDFTDVYVMDGGSALMFFAFILTCVYGVLNMFYHITQRKMMMEAQPKAAPGPVAPQQPTLSAVPQQQPAGNPYGASPYAPPA